MPEVWLFKKSDLEIDAWQRNAYEVRSLSRYFLNTQVLEMATNQGIGVALRTLRQQLETGKYG